MKWTDGLLWVVVSVLMSALVLYGTLSNDIGELHDEVNGLRAEVRCLTEPNECDIVRLLSEMERRR